jgi:trans-2-enoyl-CoA reductase
MTFKCFRLIVQLAKHWGIKTICIVRRDDYIEELKVLGAAEVINSSTEGISFLKICYFISDA